MKRILLSIISVPALIVSFMIIRTINPVQNVPLENKKAEINIYTVAGVVQPGETLDAIFDKYKLDRKELREIFTKAKGFYNLSRLSVGSIYSFDLNNRHMIQRLQYGIDDESYLDLVKTPEGFNAEKVNIEYIRRTGSLFINIADNLISSMPSSHKEYLRLALELSDIFAWDIDFSNDIKNGDSVKLIVEELWIGEMFKGYGNILAAEFLNNGVVYKAYRFEDDGYTGYYDEEGKSLRKTLLRSPLKFKYISSYFSKSRFHPVLRIYRPHLGVDYAAPLGTPVSSAGDGIVLSSGYRGQYGKMVNIRHGGSFETYYGHLSRIPPKIKNGAKVSQGDIIGYVGATGLATGPHLDYRIKLNDRFVNALKIQLPRGESIPKKLMAEFKQLVDNMNVKFVSLTQPVVAASDKKKSSI